MQFKVSVQLTEGSKEVSSYSGSIGDLGGSQSAGEETENEYRELVLGMYE